MKIWLAFVQILSTIVAFPTVCYFFADQSKIPTDIRELCSSASTKLPNIFGPDLTICGYTVESRPSTLKASKLLTSIFKQLMYFIKNLPLDVAAFRAQSVKIQTDIREFREISLGDDSSGFFLQISFIKHLFDVLKNSADYYNRYPSREDVGSTVLRILIDRHLHALSLYNSCGKLDLDMDGQAKEIWSLQDFVRTTERIFGNLKESFSLRMVFRDKVQEVRQTLSDLARQIPRRYNFGSANGSANEYIWGD